MKNKTRSPKQRDLRTGLGLMLSGVAIPLAAATLAATALTGCGEKDSSKSAISEPAYTNVSGLVENDNYIERSTGAFNDRVVDSKYSFAMETSYGRKAVQVMSTREISKETMDSLIDEGLEVNVEVKVDELDQQIYTVDADKITVK